MSCNCMLLRQGFSGLYVSGTQSLEEGEVPFSVNWKSCWVMPLAACCFSRSNCSAQTGKRAVALLQVCVLSARTLQEEMLRVDFLR